MRLVFFCRHRDSCVRMVTEVSVPSAALRAGTWWSLGVSKGGNFLLV